MELAGGGDIVVLSADHDGEHLEKVNISDVLDAINIADPQFGGGVDSMARVPAAGPEVSIEEQPAKSIRFRYECEGRSAGSIPGANSTTENKTYPTLRMTGYTGPCTIVVSCVTKDTRRPHPHNLVGREKCERGVCTIRHTFTEDNPLVQFKNLGIQCVRKRDAETALQRRQELRVDPFRTGFDPLTYPSIELNAVRLAFQVFLPDEQGRFRVPLRALASNVIYDKKAKSDLHIVRASHCSGPVSGGTQMILLCDKLSREEVTVKFFDTAGWTARATVVDTHKQAAIVIETPVYTGDSPPENHVQVQYRLERGLAASEDDVSSPFTFEYIPSPDNFTGLPYLYDQQIKIEPNRSPTHPAMSPAMYSPVSPYQEQQKQWAPEGMMAAGNNPFAEMQWPYQAIPPFHPPQYGSPSHAPQYSPSPHMQTLSPPGQIPHPHSPGMVSPGLPVQMGAVSPALGTMGHVSPALGTMGQMSPMQAPMGNISPLPPAFQPQQQQHQPQQVAGGLDLGGTGPPSLGALLNADSLPQLGAELFNISSMDQNLSDSLNRLSTSDLHMQF